MANHFPADKTTRNVQSSIDRFESLSLKKDRTKTNTHASQSPIIEVDQSSESTPLLTIVSSKPTDTGRKAELIDAQSRSQIVSHQKQNSTAFLEKSYLGENATSLADDARKILRSQPGLADIEAVLLYIHYGITGQHDFNIKITSPKASLLVQTIVTTTLPDLWPNLKDAELSQSELRMRNTLLAALFSVTGIGAILEQVRQQSSYASTSKVLADVYIDFLSHMLRGSDTVLRLLRDAGLLYAKEVQGRLFWQSVTSLFAGSKLLSTCAALAYVNPVSGVWLSNGAEYSRWLAMNILRASTEVTASEDETWPRLSILLKGGMSLGYKDIFIAQVYTSLLLGQHALWSPLHKLIQGLPPQSQKLLFDCILNDLINTYFIHPQNDSTSNCDASTTKRVSGAAALVDRLVSHNGYLLECTVDWVSSSNSSLVNLDMKRALIIVLAQSQGNLERILERSLTSFSDRNQIQHTPTTQQEHLAHTILLVIGSLHHLDPEALKKDPFPTLIMQAVTNRLTFSVPRVRLLGMIIGVGMSRCVDSPEKVMDFHVEEMETSEVQAMIALIDLHDHIGNLEDLKTIRTESRQRVSEKHKATNKIPSRSPDETSKIIAIEEITSSEDEDDLVPYQKPLHDAEDSDEDPTLIDRSRPRAPIYILDLIKQLQSSKDKLDVIALALKTAPSLVRRKADFGTELSDNIHSLVSSLVNLQDGASKPEQQQQQLNALVACLVARPAKIGRHLALTYFNGDFSLSQRSMILVSIGLGARQLGGYTDAGEMPQSTTFPSERLPSHLQSRPLTSSKQVAQTPSLNPIAALSNTATYDMIRPLALAAAESQAGPKILQVNRTSSSRLTKVAQQSKTRKIPRGINMTLANDVYLPLASPLTSILSFVSTNPSSSGSAALILHPSTLTLHLQTLALILHTLGPTGLSTPEIFNSITHETLLLLTSLTRSKISYDGIVLPALLSLLLGLIDMTVEIGVSAQERLLGDDFAVVLGELVRWISDLEHNKMAPPRNENGGHGEGVAWTVLAAGIQVRWMEIGKRFQGRMLGLEDVDI